MHGGSALSLLLQRQPSTTLHAYVIEAGIAVFLIPGYCFYTQTCRSCQSQHRPGGGWRVHAQNRKSARKGREREAVQLVTSICVRHVGVEKWAGNLRRLNKGQINNISYVGANISVLDGRTEPDDDARCRDTHCIALTEESTAILWGLKRRHPALFINSVQSSMPNALISRPAVAAFICKSWPLPSCWMNTVHLLVFPAILVC